MGNRSKAERKKQNLKKKKLQKVQRSGVIADYEKALYNRPREETALRDGTQSKRQVEKKKFEESHFVRLSKSKRERKMLRLQRAKDQRGERVDNFAELNDIKHYFAEDAGGEPPRAAPAKRVASKKRVYRGKKLKKFRKKK